MDNVTIGQIIGVIGSLSILSGFFIGIYKFIKNTVLDKIEANTKDITELKKIVYEQETEIKDSKEERLVLLNGLLACLKGLHNDLNCNGPVTQGIKDIEEYLIKKSHE